MKQKITISLPTSLDKRRATAMKIAVATAGVSTVNIDEAKNQLVVTGEGVDSFALIRSLRMRFKSASIVSVEEVKPAQAQKPADDKGKQGGKDDDKKKKDDEKKKKDDESCKPCPPHPCPCSCHCPCPYPPPNPPCLQYYPVCPPALYDPYPQNYCSIL